ncbi:MAG: hypothetical protein JSU86_08465, partial [Phycisphaerales bacterium]
SSTEEDGNANYRLDVGEDTNGNYMLDTLRDPFKLWLSANVPPGITVVYVDDWLLYHLRKGEVHCSSNEQRLRAIGPKWWEHAP